MSDRGWEQHVDFVVARHSFPTEEEGSVTHLEVVR